MCPSDNPTMMYSRVSLFSRLYKQPSNFRSFSSLNMVDLSLKAEIGGSGKNEYSYRRIGALNSIGDFGEDAYMYQEDQDMVYMAVADGVGSWRQAGVDPLKFPFALMKQVRGLCQEPTASTSSCFDLIQTGYAVLKDMHLKKVDNLLGTSTFCFARINKKTGFMEIANIGDSILAVHRGQSTYQFYFQTEPKQSSFNCPIQIGIEEREQFFDCRLTTDAYTFQLLPGDQIFMASDGIWDKIDKHQVTGHLASSHPNKIQNIYQTAKSSGRAKKDDISIIHVTVSTEVKEPSDL